MTGKQLKKIRKHLKWTQVQLAKAVGVTSNTLARWERDAVGIGEPIARFIQTVIAKGKKKSKKKGGRKR